MFLAFILGLVTGVVMTMLHDLWMIYRGKMRIEE